MWVRIHDMNFTIVDFGNFVFNFGFTYFLLRNAGKQQANSRQSQIHRHVSPNYSRYRKLTHHPAVAGIWNGLPIPAASIPPPPSLAGSFSASCSAQAERFKHALAGIHQTP
jgi:hypothetical protein